MLFFRFHHGKTETPQGKTHEAQLTEDDWEGIDVLVFDLLLQRWNQSFGVTHLTPRNFEERLESGSVLGDSRYRSDIQTSPEDELFWIPSLTNLEQGQPSENKVYVVRFRKSDIKLDDVIARQGER